METELERLLADLVSIDSVNPDLVPGARGEGEIAAFVAQWLRKAGLEVILEETRVKGRPNVMAVARGSGGGRTLMLNAHMDTVGVAGMSDPFTPVIRDGRLFGRGALDTKSALAAFMARGRRRGPKVPARRGDPGGGGGRGIREPRDRDRGGEMES